MLYFLVEAFYRTEMPAMVLVLRGKRCRRAIDAGQDGRCVRGGKNMASLNGSIPKKAIEVRMVLVRLEKRIPSRGSCAWQGKPILQRLVSASFAGMLATGLSADIETLRHVT